MDTGKLTGIVSKILAKEFDEPQKRRFVITGDRMNFACPLCGDSGTNSFKKRGNIYFSSLTYHCFNCNAHYTLPKFLSKFGYTCDDSGITGEDLKASAQNKVKHANRSRAFVDIPDELCFSIDSVARAYRCVPVNANPKAVEYLTSRGITDFSNFMYSAMKNYIVILNKVRNRVIGIQIRNLNKDNGFPKYQSQCYSKIYKKIHGEDCTLDSVKLGILDDFSLLFNYNNIDVNRSFYVLEGYIDSMFINNSIALCGACRDNRRFLDFENVKYIFDNDAAGRKRSMNMLRTHKNVFMWKKFLEDFDKNNRRPKDINDAIVQKLVTPEELNGVIDKYFTNDEFMSICL